MNSHGRVVSGEDGIATQGFVFSRHVAVEFLFSYQIEDPQVWEAREALHDLYPVGGEVELLELGAALQALDPREESPMD
jgi:hypothetical protein